MRPIACLAAVCAASSAVAGPTCTHEPKHAWMAVEAFKAKVAEAGHRIDVFKTTAGNCYEIYGRDASGSRVEIYFDPVTGRVVKETAIR